MPLERPTLPQLIDQGAAEFEGRLPGVLVRVRRSLVGVINRVVAAGLSGLYQFVEYLNRQVWPDLADAENLVGHGNRWSRARIPAAPATGSVTFTGTDGKAVPAGTVVQRGDGVRYVTDDVVVIAAGAAIANVTAETAGQAGNSAIATPLTLASPINGVNSALAASTALAGGADIEDVEAWRSRILARIRRAPQGGAGPDYIQWGLEVPGVTRVWVYPRELGAGTVTVRFARDNDASPIPDVGEVQTMQDYIDERRPVTADVYVFAPTAVPLDFTIQLTPNTPQVQAAVEAELRDVLRREGEPGGTLLLTHLSEAISIAAGERNHVLASPSADVVHGTGQMPVIGVITWLP